jgi:hypothetical protein
VFLCFCWLFDVIHMPNGTHMRYRYRGKMGKGLPTTGCWTKMMLILRNDHFVGGLVSTAVHIRGKGGRVTEMVIQSRYVSLT